MKKETNLVTKKTLRYGRWMHISFVLTFVFFTSSVMIATSLEDPYWILTLLPITITLPLTYTLYQKIQVQKTYRNELIIFISSIKPLIGKQYADFIHAIGLESVTIYDHLNDKKIVIRHWYALGYIFTAIFDENDHIIEYIELNGL